MANTNLDITYGFSPATNDAIDRRLVLSKTEMLSLDSSGLFYYDELGPDGRPVAFMLPEEYICVCKDDSQLYTYSANNAYTATTGKFRAVASDGAVVDVDTLPEVTVYNKDELVRLSGDYSYLAKYKTVDLPTVNVNSNATTSKAFTTVTQMQEALDKDEEITEVVDGTNVGGYTNSYTIGTVTAQAHSVKLGAGTSFEETEIGELKLDITRWAGSGRKVYIKVRPFWDRPISGKSAYIQTYDSKFTINGTEYSFDATEAGEFPEAKEIEITSLIGSQITIKTIMPEDTTITVDIPTTQSDEEDVETLSENATYTLRNNAKFLLIEGFKMTGGTELQKGWKAIARKEDLDTTIDEVEVLKDEIAVLNTRLTDYRIINVGDDIRTATTKALPWPLESSDIVMYAFGNHTYRKTTTEKSYIYDFMTISEQTTADKKIQAGDIKNLCNYVPTGKTARAICHEVTLTTNAYRAKAPECGIRTGTGSSWGAFKFTLSDYTKAMEMVTVNVKAWPTVANKKVGIEINFYDSNNTKITGAGGQAIIDSNSVSKIRVKIPTGSSAAYLEIKSLSKQTGLTDEQRFYLQAVTFTANNGGEITARWVDLTEQEKDVAVTSTLGATKVGNVEITSAQATRLLELLDMFTVTNPTSTQSDEVVEDGE